jgi:hypothetical protein
MRPVIAVVVVVCGLTLWSGNRSPALAQVQIPPGQSINDLQAAQNLASVRDGLAAREVIPLQVQVVISKYQGDKKVSSLPYLMSFNTSSSSLNTGGSVRMGTQIAVPTTNTVDGKTTTSYNYKDIGTSIDCGASARPDGAFNVYIAVSDSAVYSDDQPKSPTVVPATPLPIIRSYQTTNRLILKDGQSSQFTAATDRITGEVIKIDVTLKVMK